MDKKFKSLTIFLIILLVFITAGYFLWQDNLKNQNQPKLDAFAKCLKDKGAVFYGAFWCSHCQSQKKIFGESEKYLPYVECSAPDGNSETQACKDAGIKGYPTWKFKDKSINEGELSLKDLANKTGCKLSD